ncbi:MAG: O-antigen ligase family protein [Methylophilaceae bacterium]
MHQTATLQLDSQRIALGKFSRYLPYLLPLLLLFSRALADATVLLVGLSFLLRSYQLSEWCWAKQTWFKLSLLFWLYLLLINTPLSIDKLDSLMHAIGYIRWPLFANALAYWLLRNSTIQRSFLISLLLVSLFIITDTSLQYLTGHDLLGHAKATPTRLTGPYARPIPGIMLLRIWFIGLFAAMLLPPFSNEKYRVKFIISMLGLGLVFMFITGERMALILFLAGCSVVTFGLLLTRKVNLPKLLTSLLIIVSLLLTLLISAPDTAERSVFSIATKLTHFASSDYGVVFRAAFAAWQENFIFGSGIHTYKTICENLGVLSDLGKQWDMQCSHPHNLYLHIAAETGLVGLLLFSLSVVSIYYHALSGFIKTNDWLTVSLSFSVLSVCFWPLIGGISILNNSVAALVWLGVGWVLSISQVPATKSNV